MAEKKTVKSVERCTIKRFKCRVEGYVDCPNLKDRVEYFTTVTLEINSYPVKTDIQELVRNRAMENVLFRIARMNNIIPEYVFWQRKEDVIVEILERWVVPPETEKEQFVQFALDL